MHRCHPGLTAATLDSVLASALLRREKLDLSAISAPLLYGVDETFSALFTRTWYTSHEN